MKKDGLLKKQIGIFSGRKQIPKQILGSLGIQKKL